VAGRAGGAQQSLIGVGGAAVFFGILAITLVLITGDPKAGTPVVRLSLAHVGDVSGPPGWKQALPQDVPATRRWTTRWSSSTTSAPAVTDAGPMNGQAVITLPGGGSAPGAFAGPARRCRRRRWPASRPRPRRLLPVIGLRRLHLGQAYARPFTPTPPPRGPDHRRPRPQRQGHPRGDRDLARRRNPVVRPYADGLQGWIDMARAAGHEVLLENGRWSRRTIRTTTPVPTP